MRTGNERKPSSPSSSPGLDCEVELGLKMQPTRSYSCDGGGPAGGPFFSSPCLSTIYQLPATPSEGCGKALFTQTQWAELERQKMIHKYIVASIPVPPQLLLPASRSPHPSSLPQCNSIYTSGVDLRYSTSGSDPEPWRCKRTDGKKWRCSRDVAGDQKYCERHAHKTKPRSRKLVELSSHKPYILPPSSNIITTPTYIQTSSFDHTRCIEWLMKDSNTVSARKQQQWEQLMHLSSSSSSSSRTEPNKNMPLYQAPYSEEKQGSYTGMNPYIPDTSFLELKALPGSTTRRFIDAWEKEDLSNNLSSNSSSSLSLSMCGGNDNENGDLSLGVMSGSERESDGIMKAEWMNPGCWMNMNMNMNMNSPPGGPLGEALCLGNASVTRGCSELASPHGCSKRCCGEGKHALNFIG